MRSVDLVISSYKEDLKWLNDIPATFRQVYIYNKGPGMISGVNIPYTEIKLKNIGRCDHTYLYHIIHNYDNLADVTIFATGSTHALSHKRNKFRFTLNKTLETRNSVFYADRYENVKEDLYNFTMESYHASYSNNNIGVNSTKMIQANTRPFGKWYDEHFPNLDIHAVTYSGVFSVSKEHIHQHDADEYIRLINDFPFHPNPEVGHYFERSWIAIFDPIPEECLFYTNNMNFQLSKMYKNTCQNFYFLYIIVVIALILCIWYILNRYGRTLKIRSNEMKLFMYISTAVVILCSFLYLNKGSPPLSRANKDNKFLCIIAAHPNTQLKKEALERIVVEFKRFGDVVIVTSTGFSDISKEVADMLAVPIISIANDPIKVNYAKHVYYLNNYDVSKYDRVILTNDSYYILKDLDRFISLCETNVELVGYTASNEIQYHYTDFLRCYNRAGIKKIKAHYNSTRPKSLLEAIKMNEVESTDIFSSKFVLHEAYTGFDGNIFFDDSMLYRALVYDRLEIIKIKSLTRESELDLNKIFGILKVDMPENL